MTNIRERITQRLAALDIKPRAASLASGMSADAIRDIFRRPDNSPTLDTIEKLSKGLKTNPLWLAFGKGDADSDDNYCPAKGHYIDIIRRAEDQIEKNGLSEADLADIANGNNLLNELRWAAEEGRPIADAISITNRIAKAIGINPMWLFTGFGASGEETGDGENTTEIAQAAKKIEKHNIKSLVGYFDPDETNHEDYEPRMVEGTMGRDVGSLPKDAILLVDVALGMGPGGITHITELMAPDGNSYGAEDVKDWVRLPADIVRGRFRVPAHRIRCFEAIGDSMEPKVHDGDIVFVDVGHRVPSPPGIYALADALGGVILKRLSISAARGQDPVMVDLISDNPKIPLERRTLEEITITGRYLGRLTTE